MGTEPGFQVRGPDRGSGLDLAEALVRLRDGQGPYRADGSRAGSRRTEQPYATGSAIVVEHDAARLDPAVWGTETSMTAEAASLRTAPVQREENGMRVFFLEHDHTRTPRPVPSGMALPGLTRT